MYSVFEIANWFLEKEPMTHKKLQKLCYYAQAWSLVLDTRPLFDEKFEAWAHGPVNRELWNRFKEYGYSDIPQNACLDSVKLIDNKIDSLLNSVWDTYGEMTGFQLEDLTHDELPWIEARGNIPYYAPSTAIINEKTMLEYYKSQYSGDGIGE